MATFAPILSIIALAGHKDALHDAAFEGLAGAVRNLLAHGNKRPFDDTLTALAQTKGKRSVHVAAVVTSAYDMALISWENIKKTAPESVEARATVIVSSAATEFSRLEDEAATKKAKNLAEKKAEKAAKERAAKRQAAQVVAEAATAAPAPAQTADAGIALADAVQALRAALVSGSDDAFAALLALVDEFTEAVAVDSDATTATAFAVESTESAKHSLGYYLPALTNH